MIDDDTKEIRLGGNEYFYRFDENEDVTSEADRAYMDTLNKLTGSGKYVYHVLMREDWDQDLGKDNKDYTGTFM